MSLTGDLKLLFAVSRPEFIPANSASLVIGVAWAFQTPFNLVEGIILPAGLTFIIISFIAAFAAQINTLSDIEYDRSDPAKKKLVTAMDTLGEKKVRKAMVLELALSLVFLGILYNIHGSLHLLFFWILGVFFAYTYSAPPLRFKSRSWLAMVVLFLVLSIIPVSFVYYALTSLIQPNFFLFLAGQAVTVYGIIIPAEIRDYFIDRDRKITTFTVHLGLMNATRLAITLLVLGGGLCGIGFLFDFLRLGRPWFLVSLILFALVYGLVLRQYIRLYRLSRSYQEGRSDRVDQEITALAAHNPTWIMVVSQSIVVVCLILMVAKIWPV